jgi:hypothetical protein
MFGCFVPDLKVQVRRLRASCISRYRYSVALLYGKNILIGINVQIVCFSFVLLLLKIFCHFSVQALQMPVNRNISVRMCDVKTFTVTKWRYLDPRNISICNSKNIRTFPSTGFNIQPSVKMIRTEFSEVTCDL